MATERLQRQIERLLDEAEEAVSQLDRTCLSTYTETLDGMPAPLRIVSNDHTPRSGLCGLGAAHNPRDGRPCQLVRLVRRRLALKIPRVIVEYRVSLSSSAKRS